MDIFKEFEKDAIRVLAVSVVPKVSLERVFEDAQFVSYEYTGSGYFLTVRHALLQVERVVCDRPFVMGKYDGILSGFIVFIEKQELTLACHTWGEQDVPSEYRDRPVKVFEQDVPELRA